VSLLDTEIGGRQVEETLLQLDHGVYAWCVIAPQLAPPSRPIGTAARRMNYLPWETSMNAHVRGINVFVPRPS